jgi:hypothetical protein
MRRRMTVRKAEKFVIAACLDPKKREEKGKIDDEKGRETTEEKREK